MTQLFYTGVGSRNTPPDALHAIHVLAQRLEQHGYILRTGDARGADAAFRGGAFNDQIYTADYWQSRNPEMTQTWRYNADSWGIAEDLATYLHPAWGNCTSYARRLLTRNGFQVMGSHMQERSQFVVCWTPDGVTEGKNTTRATGGTGQTIRLASHFNIPVFNLNNPDSAAMLWKGI